MLDPSTRNAVVAVSMDGGYGDQARQVLAALHHRAGWAGDYMLLCHDVPGHEIEWFSRRGVHVVEVPHLFCNDHLPAVTFSRYTLFKESVRHWKHVVFLDLDMIVRGPLSALTGLSQLGAVRGYKSTIRENFVREKDPALFDALEREFDLDLPAFNGGMMAYPTSVIGPDTFERVCELTRRFLPISRFANQGLLNLLFHGAWTQLSPAYNAYVPTYLGRDGALLLPEARILHFNGRDMKPWDPRSASYARFSGEWQSNLDAAYGISWFPRRENESHALDAGRAWLPTAGALA